MNDRSHCYRIAPTITIIITKYLSVFTPFWIDGGAARDVRAREGSLHRSRPHFYLNLLVFFYTAILATRIYIIA